MVTLIQGWGGLMKGMSTPGDQFTVEPVLTLFLSD
jgi:hypothetical protein